MVAARRVITLSIDPDQRRALVAISRSRSEATGRVRRARMIIAYLDTPSVYVVARQIGVSQQTVTRCLERAAELGVLAALDDRPRAGRDAVITREARAWLVSLACASRSHPGIHTSCGQPACWSRMRVTTGRRLAIPAWRNSPREQCARSWRRMRSSRTKSAITWSSATPISSQKWQKCFAFTARSRCGARPPRTVMAGVKSPSSRMTRNPVFKRSAIPLLISPRFPAPTPPRSATMSTSATAR